MKLVLLAAAALAGLVLAAPALGAQSGRLTIPRLGIYNMPIYGPSQMGKGPFWNTSYGPRPGSGKLMVIGGHDVTPVPGYGWHGPFYYLVRLQRGDLVEIRWNSTLYKYRVVASARWLPEGIVRVQDPGIEVVLFFTCWPRHTHNGRQWVQADIVGEKEP